MSVGICETDVIGVPQLKQKRLSAGTSLEHDGHFIVLSPIFAIADQDQILISGATRQDQPVVGRPVEIPNVIRREVGQLSGRAACEGLDPDV
jgi:hypothetical protein